MFALKVLVTVLIFIIWFAINLFENDISGEWPSYSFVWGTIAVAGGLLIGLWSL